MTQHPQVRIDIEENKLAAPIKRLNIELTQLCYSVKMKSGAEWTQKQILQNISGSFKAGRLTAIMGASGAGKTSLLNVLAGEVGKSSVSGNHISGQITVNGAHVAFGGSQEKGLSMKKLSGFVFQDDVILPTMTVKEAITMSAILRLPMEISLETKKERVRQLISVLRLTKAQNTIIGSTTVKGISGGERKRTALSMEMVTNPSILFLDEPTSGLDTFTAFNVCDILRNLSRSGRTVIATIHQPSSEIFHLFDDLCLLAEGQVMYWGPVDRVVSYFSALEYKCPVYTNPADFLFMTVLNTEGSVRAKVQQLAGGVGDEKAIETSANLDNNNIGDDQIVSTTAVGEDRERERIQQLLKVWEGSGQKSQLLTDLQQQRHEDNNSDSAADLAKYAKYKASLSAQFHYLFGRAWRNAMRNKFIVRVRFAQSVFISLLVGLIYLNQPSKTLSQQIQNFGGAIFFICVNMVMSASIGVLAIFSEEKAVFTREYANGYYGLPAYFFSKIFTEMPFQIIFPILQSLIMYWMIGFATSPSYAVVVFMATLVLLSICGNALGIFFASVFSQLPVALAVTPMVLLPLMIFAGLLVNNDSIPVYFDWIKWLSPIKYGFEALVKNQFQDATVPVRLPNGTMVDKSIIATLGLDDGLNIAVCLLILLGFTIFLLAMAFMALRRVVRKSLNK